MNIKLIFFIITYISSQKWSFKMNFLQHYPYIVLNIGSMGQNTNTFIDIAHNFSFISANAYYYDESFSYYRIDEHLTPFYYNKTELKGYLSKEVINYLGKNYAFNNFFLIHTDKLYTPNDIYSKSVLSLSRNNSMNNYSLLNQLVHRGVLKRNILSLDYYFTHEIHFGWDGYAEENNKKFSCNISDYKDTRWNCRMKSIETIIHTKYKDNSTENKNTTVYFDSNMFFNIVPNYFLRHLIKNMFTSLNEQYCDESSYRNLITYLCEDKGIEVFKNNNVSMNINFDDDFTITIPNEYLFNNKGEFVFAARDIPDFDEDDLEGDGEQSKDCSGDDWKEEYIFGYSFLRLLSVSFDADLNEVRFYNDRYLHLTNNENQTNVKLIKIILIINGILITMKVFEYILLFKVFNAFNIN